MLTRDAIALFLDDRQASNCRPRTIEFYRGELGRLARAHALLPTESAPLRKVLAGVNGAPASRHATFRALRALYRFLDGERLVVDNPMSQIRAPRLPKVHPRTLDRSDVDRLLDAELSIRDRAILTVLLDGGIRSGELRGLRGRDLRDGWILVSGKTGERRVPLSPDTLSQLRAIADGPNDPVFRTVAGKPLTQYRLYRIVSAALRASSTDGPAKNGPHLLRHTFGRHWIALGHGSLPALRDILGHADIKTTVLYTNLAGVEVDTEHKTASQLTRPTKGQIRRVK